MPCSFCDTSDMLALLLFLVDEFAHFGDGDHGEVAAEEEEEGEEEADGAEEGGVVPEGGVVHFPGGGEVFVVERLADNDEAFEPHAEVDEEGTDEEGPGA